MTKPEVVIGIDVGTTNTKLVAVDANGRVLHRDRQPNDYGQAYSSGRVDADAWWNATNQLLGRASSLTKTWQIRAIGITGTMSSVVPVDRAKLRPMAAAALIGDELGGERGRALPPDVAERVAVITGNAVAPVFALGSMLAVIESADIQQRGMSNTVLLSAKDYVRSRLTGVIAVDETEAYNTQIVRPGGGWDASLAQVVGIPLEVLPPILGSTTEAGQVVAASGIAAPEFVGLPVVAGAGDVPAALFAVSQTADRRQPIVTLGTAAVMALPLPQGFTAAPGEVGRATVSIHPDCYGRWYLMSSMTGVGAIFRWLFDLGWLPEDVAATAHVEAPPVVVPYFDSDDANSDKGVPGAAVVGICPDHAAVDLAAGGADSIAVDIADVFTTTEARYQMTDKQPVVLTGGASELVHRRGTLAALLERPTQRFSRDDATPYGAALMAFGTAGRPELSVTTPDIDREPLVDVARAYRDGYHHIRHRLASPL